MKRLNLEYIKSRRIELGLSLQDVANELGFKNASTYLKYETGDYLFKAEILPILSNILKCKIENFFTCEIAETEIKEIHTA